MSLHDFENAVATDIWWLLTARDCFCYKKWSAKLFNVIKQLFFGCSIAPHTCFFLIERKYGIFLQNVYLANKSIKIPHFVELTMVLPQKEIV